MKQETKQIITRELREILLLILLGFFMTWSGMSCRSCEFNSKEFWVMASFTSLMWIFLWKGNDYVGRAISSKISWIEFPIKRFVVGLLATMVYTLGAMYVLGVIYAASFNVRLGDSTIYSIIITIIISLFMHSRSFLLNWKQSTIAAEKLQKENIAARYESLKNQVNPHFLFNSLNALTNLVYEDQAKAVKFIKQLSEVYRYVLDTREKEVVPAGEEINFLYSYLFLQQIRFGDKLKVNIEVRNPQCSVAPLSLQMLIENAIKHNVVSEDDPLTINIFQEDNYLVVENNLQRKTQLGEPSTGIGLENIRKRYEFLSTNKIIVTETKEKFIVKLPILSI